MNPLQQTERENSAGGLLRLTPAVCALIILSAVVLAWMLVKPAGGNNGSSNGLWVMLLWFLIIAITTAALLFWGKGRHFALTGIAALVVILGTGTAFLSGDKFDAVRAAMISIVLIVMSYRRYKK